MTKFFSAEVEVVYTKKIKFRVAAATEQEANQQATRDAMQKEPGARVAGVTLQLIGETEFTVGGRIEHAKFGPGTIQELTPIGNGDFAFAIKFDDGRTVSIHGPGGHLWPEGFGR